MAWQIKASPDQSYYAINLKIVGFVTPGINIFRAPNLLHAFGPFFVDCIPITLVSGQGGDVECAIRFLPFVHTFSLP